MILDLEGATTEPSRRRHVAVLSAAAAAASLILLLVLVTPPTPAIAPPQVASPLPSPGGSPVMSVVSNTPRSLPVDLMRSSVCSESALSAPDRVPIDFGAAGEQMFLVIYDRNGRLPIAVMQEQKGTGRLILTCATGDSVVPTLNRAR